MRDPTVYTVLADRARTRTPGYLWAAVVIGATDAVALTAAHPTLWWLAAGSVSLSAYGAWGLADRALGVQPPRARVAWALRVVRVGAAAIGSAAALGMVLGLMGAALSGWIH